MIELEVEYTYEQICFKLNWKKSTGEQRRRQIECIENSFEFYHPINGRTGKPKKSYVFTKQIKEPILSDGRKGNGGVRSNAGNIAYFSEDKFDYLWKAFVLKGYNLNKYFERSWYNRIYFTNTEVFKASGFDYYYHINKIEYDENDEVVKKLFQDTIYQKLKDYIISKLCKRYAFKNNSIPKGILRSQSKLKLETLIDDDELLPIYNQYFDEELESHGYTKVIQAIANNCYNTIEEKVTKRFEIINKYNVKRMNVIKVEDFDIKGTVQLFSGSNKIEEYKNEFKNVILQSIEKSCINRIEEKKRYKEKLNAEQKLLLEYYMNQLIGKPGIVKPVITVVNDEYDWLKLLN